MTLCQFGLHGLPLIAGVFVCVYEREREREGKRKNEKVSLHGSLMRMTKTQRWMFL